MAKTQTMFASGPPIEETQEDTTEPDIREEPQDEPSIIEQAPQPIRAAFAKIPRRRGRPPGSRNKPKDTEPLQNVQPNIPEGATGDVSSPAARKRARRKAQADEPVTAEQLADVISMAHTLAEGMIGPGAHINPEDAKKIAIAAVPVLDDWGVAVAGKVVHLVALVAAITVVEVPIGMRIMQTMAEQARINREGRGQMVMTAATPTPQAPVVNPQASEVAAMTGVEVGLPL